MLHLSDDDVMRLLPPVPDMVSLMRDVLIALADGSASVAPKPQVVHEDGGFANAMPAAWPQRGLLGMKWVTVTPSNASRGLPTIDALVLLSDGTTGRTRATMGGAAMTGLRTAAVTGASLALDDRPAVFLGTGVQARSHCQILEGLGRDHLTVWGRRAEALRELQEWAEEHTPGLRLSTTTDRAKALDGAGVVISGIIAGLRGQELSPSEVASDATLLPLDYASIAGAEIAGRATVAADDLEQFEALRPLKHGEDYPSATVATGALLRDGRPDGLVVVQNLGSGLADVVLADAVVRAAEEEADGANTGA